MYIDSHEAIIYSLMLYLCDDMGSIFYYVVLGGIIGDLKRIIVMHEELTIQYRTTSII